MITLTNVGGVAMTNCFLVVDATAKLAVLFDAPDHTAAPLLDEAVKRRWDVIGLWLTHGHFDHLADHAVVKKRFPKAKILIHQLDQAKAEHPDFQTRMFGLPFVIPPLKPDGYVTNGQRLQLGSLEVNVIHTPGHAPGHVAYHFVNQDVLIGGDLIIGGSVGRTDLPDSNHQELEASIRRIMALPGKTKLLGGHGSASTLANELATNPFVQDIISSRPRGHGSDTNRQRESE